ncbi:MAG: hypothetical protein KDB03_25135 [Planctomycetales bacterium]|nr:hypothetical protein [Planctomycetales bacterium]
MVRKQLCLLAICLLATNSGCITLTSLIRGPKRPTLDTSYLEAQGYSIPPGGMPAPVHLPAGSGPSVVLEVRGSEVPQLERVPLPTDRSMFLQDLVQESHLHETFGQLEISIMRTQDPSQPPVRLVATTDDDGRVKNLGQNYALLPGDRVIAIRDQRSALEKFISKRMPK